MKSESTPSSRSPEAQRRSAPKAQTGQDPWLVLGVSPEADDERIRAAYVQKVKEFPPDRCGPEFEKVRDAYEQLKDPYRWAKYVILGADIDRPLESLLDAVPGSRRYVGPELWLAAMKSTAREEQRR